MKKRREKHCREQRAGLYDRASHGAKTDIANPD
jgi:hypothetical protein